MDMFIKWSYYRKCSEQLEEGVWYERLELVL